MNDPQFEIIDLKFQGNPRTIAAYAFPHQDGLVLVESGPGSTIPELQHQLQLLGYEIQEITHVLVTHIHLDHAGAAGWLARQGAEIYVHQVGAPHLKDPTRLLKSARRIYQDQMDELWGNFLSVPENKLHPVQDGDEIQINNLIFQVLDTPGHAFHHHAYLIDEICFSGDVGGVRIGTGQPRHLRIPMPPPEFHPPSWRDSIEKLKKQRISRIAPTHFGVFNDVQWHLDEVLRELDAAEAWMREIMPRELEIEDLREAFINWVTERSQRLGMEPEELQTFEKANPSGMSADGIKRYWEKSILSE